MRIRASARRKGQVGRRQRLEHSAELIEHRQAPKLPIYPVQNDSVADDCIVDFQLFPERVSVEMVGFWAIRVFESAALELAPVIPGGIPNREATVDASVDDATAMA